MQPLSWSCKEIIMFAWAIAFFVIALVAAVFGFTGIAVSAAGMAKVIFIIALVLAAVSLVNGRRRRSDRR
jgi:uncharacterized membrane protein YtjA (UPF0391 family)